MVQVMISYCDAAQQQAFALSIAEGLRAAGLNTWMSAEDVPRLSTWRDEIIGAIDDSDYVVLCLSPEYLQDPQCLLECYIARGYGKHLLPVIVPHEGDGRIFALLDQQEETRGLDQLNLLNFDTGRVLGLPLSQAALLQRLIQTIQAPTPLDADYEVYISFKSHQAAFATQLADDLTAADVVTFVHTRQIDVGVDWRQHSWNGGLFSDFHLVVLSPDMTKSEFIEKEVQLSQLLDLPFIPVLPPSYQDDAVAQAAIRAACEAHPAFAHLNKIAWFVPDGDYATFLAELVDAIRAR